MGTVIFSLNIHRKPCVNDLLLSPYQRTFDSIECGGIKKKKTPLVLGIKAASDLLIAALFVSASLDYFNFGKVHQRNLQQTKDESLCVIAVFSVCTKQPDI